MSSGRPFTPRQAASHRKLCSGCALCSGVTRKRDGYDTPREALEAAARQFREQARLRQPVTGEQAAYLLNLILDLVKDPKDHTCEPCRCRP